MLLTGLRFLDLTFQGGTFFFLHPFDGGTAYIEKSFGHRGRRISGQRRLVEDTRSFRTREFGSAVMSRLRSSSS